MKTRLLPLLPLLAACAYEAPLDPDAVPAAPVVAGTLVLAGPEAPADTMVLIYDADNPPPPFGTGSPLTFGTVPASAFTSAGEGLLEAPFEVYLAGVPDGDVLVTALVDTDGDFYPLPPLSTATGGATCGDWSGAHVSDLETGAFAPVAVAQNERSDGITVVVGREATIERPAFVFEEVARVTRTPDPGAVQSFRLASTGVAAVLQGDDGAVVPLLDLAGPFDGTDLCGTSFWVTVYDRDLDGVPDPHPDLGAAAMDAWPRVILQWLGPIDEQGTLLPRDEEDVGDRYLTQAALFPDVVWFGQVPLNQPTPLTRTEWVFVPQGVHIDGATGETTPVVGPEMRAGAYSVTLINVAGQTWTLPNALAGVGTSDAERFEPLSQAGALIVE